MLRSLYGACRLAVMDPSGMAHFNLTVEGFWRSFFAAVLVAPGYALLVAERMMDRPESLALGWVVLVETVAYALAWAIFPLAAIILTHWLGLARRYVPLVIAVNWAAVLQIVLFLVTIWLSLALPDSLGGLVVTAVTGILLLYQWYVVRTALQTTGGVALALVLVDVLLSTAINVSAERLYL
ncbi:MAG: hypothetical protein ACREH6_13165 [Geminicoccaceae bacterium]